MVFLIVSTGHQIYRWSDLYKCIPIDLQSFTLNVKVITVFYLRMCYPKSLMPETVSFTYSVIE